MKRRRKYDVQREKERIDALNLSCVLFAGVVASMAGVAGWLGGCNAVAWRFGEGPSVPIPPHSPLALVAVLAGLAVAVAAAVKLIRIRRRRK